MRRYVRLAAFVALLVAFPGVANANALEFLDRLIQDAENAFKTVQRKPGGPPPFRVGLMLPKSG